MIPGALSRWRIVATTRFWLIVGMVIRLLHVLSLGNRYYFGDTVEYEQAALRILHGIHLRGSDPRAPAYPWLFAISFWVGGEQNFLVAKIVQLALALLQMWLVVHLARRLGGPAAAAVAAPIAALGPTLVFIAGLLYPTLLYSTVLLALTAVAWELSERPSLRYGVLFGVLMVVGWLTDMIIVAPVLGIGIWLLVALRRQRAPLLRALAVSAITTFVLALPYLALVHREGKARVFLSKAQAVLYSARSDSVLAQDRWIRFPPGPIAPPLPMHAFVAREMGLFLSRPVAFLHDYLFELLHFFKPIADRVTSQNRFNTLPVLLVGAAWFVGLLSLSLVGLIAGAAPLRGRLLLATVVMSTAMFYAFFFTQARYRIPIEPQLVVLAALGIAKAFPRVTGQLAEAAAEVRLHDRRWPAQPQAAAPAASTNRLS